MPRFVWLLEKKGLYFATLDADAEWTESPYDALEFADEASAQKWTETFVNDYDFTGAKPVEHSFEVVTHTVEALLERVKHLEETVLTLAAWLVSAQTGIGKTDYETLRQLIDESREEYVEVTKS